MLAIALHATLALSQAQTPFVESDFDTALGTVGLTTKTARFDTELLRFWDETEFTGTGFPKVYYLEYTMYRNNFPLQALGIYRKALATGLARA